MSSKNKAHPLVLKILVILHYVEGIHSELIMNDEFVQGIHNRIH